MGGQGFLSGFIKDRKSSFKGWEEGLPKRGVRVRFMAIEEGKWRFLGGAMGGGIVVEFGSREELCPRCRVIGTKDTKINLKFLIGSFSLSIDLGVIGSGQLNIVFQEVS